MTVSIAHERALLVTPDRYEDHRGFFSETFNQRRYNALGIDADFVQDNQSVSIYKGTIRGLHYQSPPNAQAKLVRCGQGSVFDVVVDIRGDSPNYGRWEGFELSAENGCQLFVPEGFAHGFVTLQANSEIVYKCTGYYESSSEGALRWDDPDLNISWPISSEPIISEKDASAAFFKDFISPFSVRNSS